MLTLVESGRPIAVIVLAAAASAVERHAARELQSHIREISGATLPIVEALPATGSVVLIGRTAESERLLAGVDWKALKEDGVVVRTVRDRLVLAGATPRGSLYAVYEFLERFLGCRWLTPQCSVIPKRATVAVENINHTHVPVFRYREPFFTRGFEPDWAARNRVNGGFYPLDAERGGKFAYAGFVHTFYPLLPPERYFHSHPEYFSEVNGRRIGENGQLCLTNPDVIELVTRSARQLLLDQPGARIVSVSQNDWGGYCTCVNCKAVDDAEGSPSGSLIRFINAVAERLEAEFPHVLVDTLAYQYTITPPKNLRPRHNVVIRLCHLNGPCDSHPLEGCAMNSLYLEQLRGWGRVAPEVFIWDYFNNFANYFMPYPNLDAICADLPLYARSGVTGIFCQGDAVPPKGPGDMAELRAYLTAKLLWDPAADGRAIIAEFLEKYYGPGAPAISEYLELLHRPAREGPVHLTPYMTLPASAEAHLPPATLDRAEALFDSAAAAVRGDAELTRRVAAARLPIEFMRWTKELEFTRRGKRYTAKAPAMLARARRFFFDAMAQGTQGLREQSGRPIREELAELDGAELVTVELEGLRLIVAPRFGGRIMGLIDPVTGRDWMHAAAPDEPGYPVAGGYEEYSQVRWRSPGWSEPFVADVRADGLAMSATLPGGVVLERACRLEKGPHGPRLVIESTLRNGGYEPQNVLLRMHPDLAVANWRQAALLIARPDGSRMEWSPWKNAKEKEGSQWFEGDAIPAGEWSLRVGERQLVIAFTPGEISKCLPSWDRRLKSLRLDMYSHPRRLCPQQALTVRQTWTPSPA